MLLTVETIEKMAAEYPVMGINGKLDLPDPHTLAFRLIYQFNKGIENELERHKNYDQLRMLAVKLRQRFQKLMDAEAEELRKRLEPKKHFSGQRENPPDHGYKKRRDIFE